MLMWKVQARVEITQKIIIIIAFLQNSFKFALNSRNLKSFFRKVFLLIFRSVDNLTNASFSNGV